MTCLRFVAWVATIALCACSLNAQLSDLQVQSVQHSPPTPTSNDIVALTIVVANQGGGPSGGCTGRVQGSQSTYETFSIPGIATGSTASINVSNLGPWSAGTVSLTVTVDIFNVINESNETNNQAQHNITVTQGSSQQPNLQLLSIQASVNPAAPGSQTVVEVAIRNAGLVASNSCYLDLYYNRQTPPTTGLVGDDYVQISSISANTTIYRTFTVTGPASPSTWTTWVFIDTDDDVQESNENDNIASYTQQWASTALPNLRVTGMQASANPATPSSFITVR